MFQILTEEIKGVQNDSRPDLPEKTDQILSDYDRPDYSDGQQWIFNPKNRFRQVGLGFPHLKPEK